MRGNTHGKYVMARIDHDGPYALGNVKCILHIENTHESAKLSDDAVLAIYHSKASAYSLSKEYGISHTHAKRIKRGEVRRHLFP